MLSGLFRVLPTYSKPHIIRNSPTFKVFAQMSRQSTAVSLIRKFFYSCNYFFQLFFFHPVCKSDFRFDLNAF